MPTEMGGEKGGNIQADFVDGQIKRGPGLLSWDVKATGTDLSSAEKACLSVKVSAGPHNELLIQHSTETLALEVLLNPEVSTLRQCFKNMMVSGTTHKHVIHAGYAFAGSGDWILQDGVFSARDVEALLHDAEVQEVLRRQKFHTLHVHCSAEGSWAQPPVGVCLNPPDIADSLAGSAHLLGCLDAVLTSPPLTSLLPSSTVVGNIRFRRPTMYVFPGGQGDCALFGVTGFTLLVDGGFARKPCFWEFVRHLDRLDSLLVTRFNQFNSCGLTALAQRKALERVYPQVGHVFCNAVRSPSDEELQKDRDQLVVSVVAQGLEFLQGVREMGLSPQACQRDVRPHTLYHKVGHGTLEMFVLSPGRSTEEDTSVCALLVWRPAKVSEPVTRILLPGSAPQSVIFEGLNKLAHLAVLKSREVTTEARLGLKKSKVQDKPLRATSVPPRPSVAKRAAAKVESPSPSPTPPPAEKVRAPAKPTSKSIESLPKKQEEVKRPSKTSAKKEPKKTVEKTDAKDEKVAKITAKIPAKEADIIPDKEKLVEKLGENEIDNIAEKDISKIISDKPLKKLPVDIEKIDTKPQEEIVAKVDEKVTAKRELKRATPARPPAKSKGAKDVTNKMAVESKTIARKTAEPAKPKPRPVVAPPTRPMVRDSKSKSPSSSASSSPKRAPPKPTTERPVRSVRGGVRTAKPAAIEPVKAVEVEKPLPTEKPTAQVKPDKRIEIVALSGDESSGSKEAIEEKAATEATKEEKPFIEPPSSDESKKDIPKQKSPTTVDEVPIKAVLLGTAHATPAADEIQALPTKPLEKEIVDAEMWPREGDAREVVEPPEHALSPEPTISASSEGVPSLVDEVIDVSLKADSSIAMQVAEPELSRVRALSSGQRTPDSLDTPREVGDGIAPSSRDEILDAMEKHQLVSREQVLEIKRRDSVDSIEGEIAMEEEEAAHPPQEADKETAGAPIEKMQLETEKPKVETPVSEVPEVARKETAEPGGIEKMEPTTESPAEKTAESVVPEVTEKAATKVETAQTVEPEVKKRGEDVHAIEDLDVADAKPAKPEDVEKLEPASEEAAQPTDVGDVPEVAEMRPTETGSFEMVPPEIQRPAEEQTQFVEKRLAESEDAQKAVPEIERPPGETPFTAIREESQKPTELDGTRIEEPEVEKPVGQPLLSTESEVGQKKLIKEEPGEKLEREAESQPEEIPASAEPELDQKKPKELEAAEKIETETQRLVEDISVTEVPEADQKRPEEHETIEKLQLETERQLEETHDGAVSDAEEKVPTEHERVQKREPEIERPSEESSLSAALEHEDTRKLKPELDRPLEESAVVTTSEVEQEKATEDEGIAKLEPELQRPPETPLSAAPQVEQKKHAEHEDVEGMEPEIHKLPEEAPVTAVHEVEQKKPTEYEGVEKFEPEAEMPADKTLWSAMPEIEAKKPAAHEGGEKLETETEKPYIGIPVKVAPEDELKEPRQHEGVRKLEPEIDRPAEKAVVGAVPDVEQKTPTGHDGLQEQEPEAEPPHEKSPVSVVPEVDRKKSTDHEGDKTEPQIEKLGQETTVFAVPEVEKKKPSDHADVETLETENQRPPAETTETTPVSAGPDFEKKSPERAGVEKLEPEIARLPEERPLSAMAEPQQKKPTEHADVIKLETDVEKPAEETEFEQKEATDHAGVLMLEAEIKRPPDVTPATSALEVSQKKPIEYESTEKLDAVIDRQPQETTVSLLPEIEKEPPKYEDTQKLEPELERQPDHTPVSSVPEAEEKPAIQDVQKLEPKIERPHEEHEEAPVSTALAELERIQKLEPEVDRPLEHTPVSPVTELHKQKPAEHEAVEEVEPEIERSHEETPQKPELELEQQPKEAPLSSTPEVDKKKPAVSEGVQKFEPELEQPHKEILVSAVPEIERKPAEHERVPELEPQLELPPLKAQVSAGPEAVKETGVHELAQSLEPEIERPHVEAPEVPEVEKKTAVHEGLQMLETELGRPPLEAPVSSVPEVQDKKAVGHEGVEEVEPKVDRQSEEVPVVKEKPAEHDDVQELKPELEQPQKETPVGAAPKVELTKPVDHEGVQKLEPELERLPEETLKSSLPEDKKEKPAEHEDVQELVQGAERPLEEPPVSTVPEIEEMKPTEYDVARHLEPEIEGPYVETSVTSVPELEEKKPLIDERVRKLEQEIERPPEKGSVSAVPEVEEKKPEQHQGAQKSGSEIELPHEESMSAVPQSEEEKSSKPDSVPLLELETERPAKGSAVSTGPEDDKKPTEHKSIEKGETEVQRPSGEPDEGAVPELDEKIAAEHGVKRLEPEIKRPPEDAPVSAVSELGTEKPAKEERAEMVESKVQRAAEETPASAAPEAVEKKPGEHEECKKLKEEIESPREESPTPVTKLPSSDDKEGTDHEVVEEIGREIEKQPEKFPASAVREVEGRVLAEPERMKKVGPDIDRPAEETAVCTVSEDEKKKPTDLESVEKLIPESEKHAADTVVSSAPEVEEKQQSVGTLESKVEMPLISTERAEPDIEEMVKSKIERPAEEAPVSALPEVTEKKPDKDAGVEELEPEIARPPVQSHVSELAKAEEEKPQEPQSVEKLEPKVERLPEAAGAGSEPEVEKKPAEQERIVELEPESGRRDGDIHLSTMPEVEKEATEPDSEEKVGPRTEIPGEEASVKAVVQVAAAKPQEHVDVEKVKSLGTPSEHTSATEVADAAEEKPTKPGHVEMMESEIFRGPEETPASEAPVEGKKHTEPEHKQAPEPPSYVTERDDAVETGAESIERHKPVELQNIEAGEIDTVRSEPGKTASATSVIPATVIERPLETHDMKKTETQVPKEEQHGRRISPSSGDKREPSDMKDIHLDEGSKREPDPSPGHHEPEMAVSIKDKPDADTLATKPGETMAEETEQSKKGYLTEESSLDQEGIVTSPGEETADEDAPTSVQEDPKACQSTAEVHEVEDVESTVDEVVDEGVVTSPCQSIDDDAHPLTADTEDTLYDGVHITELRDGDEKEHERKSKQEQLISSLGQVQPKGAVGGEHRPQEPWDEATVPHHDRKEADIAEEQRPSSSMTTPPARDFRKEGKDGEPQQDIEDILLRESVPPQSFLFSDTGSSDVLPEETSDTRQPGYLLGEAEVLPSTALIPEVDGTIAEDLIAAKEQAQKQLEEKGDEDVSPSFSRASSTKDRSAIEHDAPSEAGRLSDITAHREKPSEHEDTQQENGKDSAPVVFGLSHGTSKATQETPYWDFQEPSETADSLKLLDPRPYSPTGIECQTLPSDGSEGTGPTEDRYGVHETALDKTTAPPSFPLISGELKEDAEIIPKLAAREDLSFPQMARTEAAELKLTEQESLDESCGSKPDISKKTSLPAFEDILPSKSSLSDESITDKVTEAVHLEQVDKLSQQETETDAAITEEHLQLDEVPETKDVKGSDEHKQSSIVSPDSGRDNREEVQEGASKMEDQAVLSKAHEEPVLRAESHVVSESFRLPEPSEPQDDLERPAPHTYGDKDHADKGLPADTSHTPSKADTSDKTMSPKPCAPSEAEVDVTKQELHLSLETAPGAVSSVYSKAKELLEECVSATDPTSPGGAISTVSPKSSVSEDSFRSVVQRDDSRDALSKEEECDDRTCDENVVPVSGVTTGYDFRSPTEVLKRDFHEETSHTFAKESHETMALQSPSQDEEGRQLLEVIKSQLVSDDSADFHVTTKEHGLPTAKDIPPADSSKYVPTGTHAESGDIGLDKSPGSAKECDEALSVILDQITKDDWDEGTHSGPEKVQVSEDAVEVHPSLSADSSTKSQPQADAPLGSEDRREPLDAGHLLVKGAPEQDKSVPVPGELSPAAHKPESPSAHMEVFEEISPETMLLQESSSTAQHHPKTREDASATIDAHASRPSAPDDSLVKLPEETVPQFPSDLGTSSAADLCSSPVPLKESAGHPDVRIISDKEEPGSATDLEIAPERGVVCDARLSSGPEGTKVRDEAPYGEVEEKETTSRGSPSLMHQEQDSYVPEAPWVHHRDAEDARSTEISDQPMKDPRATCPTSLDAPELAHMQQRMSVDYESSITSVSDIEFAADAKSLKALAPDDPSHDDSKTAECPKGDKDASRPSSPESPPQSPVKRIAAEHPRASKRARTTSESKHPISTQGSSEADISSEDEDSTRKVTTRAYTDASSAGVELPKESPQSGSGPLQTSTYPVRDRHVEDTTKHSAESYHAIPQGADDHDSRLVPTEVLPGSFPYTPGKTEGLSVEHSLTPSEEHYLPTGDRTDEDKKSEKDSQVPQLPSKDVPDPSSTISHHDVVQAPSSLLERDKAEMSGGKDSRLDETYSSELKRTSIESETTSSSDDAGSGRRSLTSSKDSDLMREYSKHLETSPSARFSVDSTCSVTSEERSYTELEKPYQKEDSRDSFSSTAREYPDDSSRSGSLYSDSTLEPSSTFDHQEPKAPQVSSDQVELSSSVHDFIPVRPERPTEIEKTERQFETDTLISTQKESDVQVPPSAEKATEMPEEHVSPTARIPASEDQSPFGDIAHGHGIASGLFAALKTELCVIDSPSMDTVLDQTGKDVQSLKDQAGVDPSPEFAEKHREFDLGDKKIPETDRETPKEHVHSGDGEVGVAHHVPVLTPDKEPKETHSISGHDEGYPGRKVSGEVTPVKALRFQLGDDSSIEPLADQTDASASDPPSDADHGLSKEVFERKVRLDKFLEAEFLEAMATDEEDESSRASVKQSTASTTSSSHHKNGHTVAEPEDDNTEDDVTLASALSSGLPTELVCMAQSSVDLPKDITRITKCADSQERVSPPLASPPDAAKQDEPAAVAAGLASGLSVELVCMVESKELCSEIKRAEEEAIHHVIEKKADYAEEDGGVAMQAYIERRLSDSDHFADKQQRASPPSETVSSAQQDIPTPERKTSKGFDELHLNGTSHSPPSVGLVAGLAAGLATELVCMPQSAEELCIDASESRWPPAQGSRVEIMPPEMTASIYEERTEHIDEKPCSDTDVESLGRGAPDSPLLHRIGQIPVQREVITTVTSRRVVYQNDGPPDTWTTSTFSEPPQQDTDDDSRRTTVTYVYRTYTPAESDDKDDPVISSGTVPSRQGEDGLPFEILRSAAERHAREEDGHVEGDHVTGTSSRSYVYTISSDHGAPEMFVRHTDDTGTLHHPDSSIHNIAMDEVARITEMAAAAVSQSSNGWTVVHRSADSSSQRPLELTRPSELVERRNGHVTQVTEARQIVYHPSSSAEFRFPVVSSAEETCLPPEGSDPKTILEFMAAQTKQAAKEMLEEQPLYEEDEEAAQEQSSLSDASPLVEEPVFGKTLQPDYPELVELSAGNTPSEPPSPHSAVHDTRARHNGEASGTTASVQRLVETVPASAISGGSEARRVVSYVEEPTTVVREEWVLEGGRGEASHVISQSSMFQHEVLTREESRSAGTTLSSASTGDDGVRFTTHHHLERDPGAVGDVSQLSSLKASMAAALHEEQRFGADSASRTAAPHDTVREHQATSTERQANGRRDGDTTAPFDIRDWGKPLGLPVPPDPSSKSSKTKKTGAAATPRDAADVVYVDLTYVPHHGDPGYCDVEFFSRVRARYYVLSGTNPSQQVLDALLEAKRGWGEPDAPVTVIPTYETDALCYWIAHNQKALEEHHIDVAPSASRCTINLQDHESSCAAYRLEF
ncbi:hypothetical protein HPB50_017688 [Hyalomma asiaticum]|uniref:Uncharacterized protein n=1 Tax=Hyalomma asiaticum TaxID=266040 RepID=A0ACB7SEV8_HYAAI|nr:hypothetical protein HPB50_017688 [Hyalomma asiaticum]